MTTEPASRPVARRPRGQATVELALALPFVALTLLLVVQVLLVAHGQLTVDHAAREAARIAAVDPEPAAARQAALAGGLAPGRTTVAVRPVAGSVSVEVGHRFVTDVPLVGALVPDVAMRATATFRAEFRPP